MVWYNDFGYATNPFVYDGLSSSDELINHDKELVKLLYWVESGSIAMIEGPEASGKSRLAREVIKKFGGRGRVVYVDGEKKSKHLDISHLLLYNQSLFRKSFNLMPKNMILILDNAKALSKESYQRLQYFFDQDYLQSIILITRKKSQLDLPKSMVDRIGNRIIKTKFLKKEQLLELVKERMFEDQIFTDKNLEDVYKKSKGLKNYLENLENLAVYMVENDVENVNVKTINKVLKK